MPACSRPLCHSKSPRPQCVTYLTAAQLGPSESRRSEVFDLYCESETGEKFIVEMQKAKQKYFKDRSVFYSTFPIREQAQRGQEWDFQLNAVCTVGILDFVFDEDKDSPDCFHHHVQLMSVCSDTVWTQTLAILVSVWPSSPWTANTSPDWTATVAAVRRRV